MSAWTILTGNSTAPQGSTAWIHLNNQAGGSGGGDIIVGGILSADIDTILNAEIGDVLSADLLMTELTANIVEDLSSETDSDLGASI